MMSSKAEITVVFAIASILLFSPTFAQAPNVISTNHQSFASTPFAGINLCAPINLFITPNASQGYSFTAEGETSAINNIKAAFNDSNGLLYITATGPIITNQTLKLTVSLPASNLTVLHHNGPSAAIYVAPGFSPPFLNVTTGFGAGQLYINNISTNAVSLDMSGIGPVVITGMLGSVSATSNSIGGLYLTGVQSTAQLNLSSTANAYIDTASPSTSISGSATGLNTVQYTAGTCSLSSSLSTLSGIFPHCMQVTFLSVPAPTPTWTCGIAIQGNFTCQPGAVLSSSTAGSVLSQGGGAPTLTTTVPGGFVSQGQLGSGSSQFQAGMAVPGAASAQAGISSTSSGSSSSSASASSSSTATSGGTASPGGTSISTTQTTQNGISQGFVTSSGGQQATSFSSSPGVLITAGMNETAQATATTCAAPLESVRIPLSGAV